MNKETLLSYVGKGTVNHKGYKIEVRKDYLEKMKEEYIQIELKPLNKYTDSAYFEGILKYIKDNELEKIEETFEKTYKIMKEQEKNNNIEPLKLKQIKELSRNYRASFKDSLDNKYVLMNTAINGKSELCIYFKEPEYPIRVPIEINGKVIKSNYSFWLGMGIYNTEEIEQVLEKDELEEDN